MRKTSRQVQVVKSDPANEQILTTEVTPQVFNFENLPVRIVFKGNAPWFVAKDVCDVLGLSNPTKAVSNLDEDERSNFLLGRQGNGNVISESGLYALIMRSNKPTAKAFRKWVTSEVLPSIRNQGEYIAKPALKPQLTFDVLTPGMVQFDDLDNCARARAINISLTVENGRILIDDIPVLPIPVLLECFDQNEFTFHSAWELARPHLQIGRDFFVMAPGYEGQFYEKLGKLTENVPFLRGCAWLKNLPPCGQIYLITLFGVKLLHTFASRKFPLRTVERLEESYFFPVRGESNGEADDDEAFRHMSRKDQALTLYLWQQWQELTYGQRLHVLLAIEDIREKPSR